MIETPSIMDVFAGEAGLGEHDEGHAHGWVEAAELRGEVQVVRPLRGGAGPRHSTGGAAEEEAEEIILRRLW